MYLAMGNIHTRPSIQLNDCICQMTCMAIWATIKGSKADSK